MPMPPFKLERYFARYEFSTPFQLSPSDCEGVPMQGILDMADEETLEMWRCLHLGYTESRGLSKLREEIAKLHGDVEQDDIQVVAPEEGIFIAMQTLLNKGDRVVTTYPAYQSLFEIAKSMGCEVDHWTPDEKQGWRYDLDDLGEKLTSNTKLLVVNFPHNPTGALPRKEDYEQMMSMAKERGVTVFSDEMFRFLELDPADRLPSAVELDEKAISLSGMSKTFGLAGMRIGWLVSKNRKMLRRMQSYRHYTTGCSSAPSEVLALIALRAKQKIITENVERIRRNIAELDRFFSEYSHVASWVRPRAGCVCFPKLELDETASSFCKRAINEAGIMILPSTVYDYGNRHFRVGYGRQDFPETLDRFKDFLDHPSPDT